MEGGCLGDIKETEHPGNHTLKSAPVPPLHQKFPGPETYAAYLVFGNPMLFWGLAVEL